MEHAERQRDHFDRIARTYSEARKGENHRLVKQLMWAEFFRGKPWLKRDGLSVLEAMCGSADGKQILEENLGIAVHYRGFDYSAEMVARINKSAPELDVVEADVTRFEADSTYDLVMVLGGLHHVPFAAEEAMRRLVAAMAPGGWFIGLEPTHGNPVFAAIRSGIYKRNALFDEVTEKAFSVREYRALLEGAGLEIVDMMHPGLLSYVLYYNPDAFPGLNFGGSGLLRSIFALERRLFRTWVGQFFGFATIACCRKPAPGEDRRSSQAR